MKYIVFLLCLAGIPLLGQPSGSPEQRQAKAEATKKRRAEERNATVIENRVEQEVQRRMNTERQAAQTAAVQAQQAASPYYGGYGYNNRWPMPVYQVRQEGVVAIAQKVSNSKELFETGLDCLKTATKLVEKKEALNFCKDLAKEALKTSKVIADQAAESTVRPPILIPRYGW